MFAFSILCPPLGEHRAGGFNYSIMYKNPNYQKEYREKHKEETKKYNKEYRKKNFGYYKEYQKKWAKNNPEKVKKHAKKNYQQHKEKRIKYIQKWREKNIEKRKKYEKKYTEEHKKETSKYRQNHQKQRKENQQCWVNENRDYVYFYNAKRRAKKRNAEGSHTFKEWLDLKEKCNYICQMCGLKEPFESQSYKFLTQDHITPLDKGGSDYIDNIQPLCKSCNSIKGNR